MLGECDGQVFLGTLHERDWEKGIIYLSQPRHIDTLLFDHGFDAERHVRSPLDHKVVLLPTREHQKPVRPRLSSYPGIIRSVMYIANCARPDLCYASLLVRLIANPRHLEQAFRVLRLLVDSKSYRLQPCGCYVGLATPEH